MFRSAVRLASRRAAPALRRPVRFASASASAATTMSMTFAVPTLKDSAGMFNVVEAGTLDTNSAYMYLLFGSHFRNTSLVAHDAHGRVVGFIAAYVPPSEPDALFVWQVGVLAETRGTGLASKMLDELFERVAAANPNVKRLTATVTPNNEASRNLFASFGRRHNAQVAIEENHFPASAFPSWAEPKHESEDLFDIGPVENPKAESK